MPVTGLPADVAAAALEERCGMLARMQDTLDAETPTGYGGAGAWAVAGGLLLTGMMRVDWSDEGAAPYVEWSLWRWDPSSREVVRASTRRDGSVAWKRPWRGEGSPSSPAARRRLAMLARGEASVLASMEGGAPPEVLWGAADDAGRMRLPMPDGVTPLPAGWRALKADWMARMMDRHPDLLAGPCLQAKLADDLPWRLPSPVTLVRDGSNLHVVSWSGDLCRMARWTHTHLYYTAEPGLPVQAVDAETGSCDPTPDMGALALRIVSAYDAGRAAAPSFLPDVEPPEHRYAAPVTIPAGERATLGEPDLDALAWRSVTRMLAARAGSPAARAGAARRPAPAHTGGTPAGRAAPAGGDHRGKDTTMARDKATFSGNLAGEPRYFEPAGERRGMLAATILHTNRVRRPDGTWEDAGTDRVDVRFFGDDAEAVHAAGFRKGDPVIVTGRWGEPDAWRDAQGRERSTPVILGDAIGIDQIRQTRRERARERAGAQTAGMGYVPAAAPAAYGAAPAR